MLHVSAFSNLSPGFIGMIYHKPAYVAVGFISNIMCVWRIQEKILVYIITRQRVESTHLSR